jgi:hypothetical protein
MTSQINANNINGDYPVPGVANNSQGMRDNFTNTKTNFQFAANEITALQNNAVFKAALSGTTLDNNMNDNLIYAVQLSDVSWKLVTLTATSGSIALDFSAGNWYVMPSQTGNTSLSFSNWPVSGTAGTLRFRIVVSNTAYTLTLPAAVSINTTGLQGYASNVITFNATGTYDFEFSTIDGGISISVVDLSRPKLASSAAPLGYATGSGSTVTQTGSRTTGVTINTLSGAITLISAAGSTSWQSFTVTNSQVAATDLIVVNQKSGTDLYRINVTAVGTGSFRITYATTAGTTTEQPVFNFAVIKGVAA